MTRRDLGFAAVLLGAALATPACSAISEGGGTGGRGASGEVLLLLLLLSTLGLAALRRRRRNARFGPGIACLIAVCAALVGPAAPAHAATPASWWHTGYLWDYGLTLGGLGAYGGFRALSPAGQALLGPSYDPANPSRLLDDPAVALDQPHLRQGAGETVPTSALVIGLPSLFVLVAAQDALRSRANDGAVDLRSLHDVSVGYAQAISWTMALVAAGKVSTGRLRPDFEDRVRRHHCAGGGTTEGIDCDGVGPALDPDPREATRIFEDGRRSFPSGHASTAAAAAMYTSLVVGGRYVWGEEATTSSISWGILAQTALVTAGTLIAVSRLDDGRHHLGDVAAGSMIGIGMANLAYWRHFDGSGRPRSRTESRSDSGQVE